MLLTVVVTQSWNKVAAENFLLRDEETVAFEKYLWPCSCPDTEVWGISQEWGHNFANQAGTYVDLKVTDGQNQRQY